MQHLYHCWEYVRNLTSVGHQGSEVCWYSLVIDHKHTDVGLDHEIDRDSCACQSESISTCTIFIDLNSSINR